MNASIKIISLNIEGDKHLDRVIPFLKKEDADVVCLQEVLEKDIGTFKNELQIDAEYVPQVHIIQANNPKGLLSLSKIRPDNTSIEYYSKIIAPLPEYAGTGPTPLNRAILITEITKDSTPFKIINTHFTWSPDGEPTPLQRAHLESLLKLLSTQGEFILCGDFNMPRGRGLWEKLAEMYTDNIPQAVTTTLDQNLHKAKGLQFVVDGIFSTKGYELTDVRVVDGVSDHQAIVGVITKK